MNRVVYTVDSTSRRKKIPKDWGKWMETGPELLTVEVTKVDLDRHARTPINNTIVT